MSMKNTPPGNEDQDRLKDLEIQNQKLTRECEILKKALEAERARLSAIIASSNGAIAISDPDGKIINPTNSIWDSNGITISDVGGGNNQQDGSFCYEDGKTYSPEDMPLHRSARYGEAQVNLEMCVIRPDGNKRFFQVNTAPILDRKGKIMGAIGVMQDITHHIKVTQELQKELAERQKVEEALRESQASLLRSEEALRHYAIRLEHSNQNLEDFAFIASHDLQEPLRKVQSFGERLKDSLGGQLSEVNSDYLNRMINATQRMSIMLRDLLSYSRISTKVEPYQVVSLNKLVQEVLSDLELAIETSSAQIEVGDLPSVEADATQMSQLFQNLISNAIKFKHPETIPVVRIHGQIATRSGKTSSPEVMIFVQDNGIGFDMQFAERIFQPFQRLHGRSKYEGTGIGLAICKKIVERHGGTITVESQTDVGTTFTIRLPIKQSNG